ncbi:MAG: type II toxin-antitoxin system VapC family toxin [Deltaproteobacteria bacterium]|nr:MAG: type II toxin-antitoxin system VapC family toxin [Deltaproteobacteria bacterium]
MRLLLDSHVFLWWLRDDRRLSRRARAAIAAPGASVVVSAASIWEIAIKLSLGKLQWRDRPGVTLERSITACGFGELPVTARHAATVRNLPPHHGDPFDRLLVAQALTEDLRIVTADDVFALYGAAVLAAED